MARNTITLGRVFGIPIGLDYSWFLIFILLTWSLATSYYPSEFTGQPDAVYWGLGAVTAVLLFVSVLLHELAHSVVARAAKLPVSSITLYIFGGVSQIAAEPSTAGIEFRMALAGPLTSFALALVAVALQPLAAGSAAASAVLRYLAIINLSLGAFNLIPGFPLDGGRVFRSLVWRIGGSFSRATAIAGSGGRLVAYLFIIFGVWQVLNGMVANGLWIVFIGWFLENAASAQVQQQVMQDLLAGRKVSDAMNRAFRAIPAETSLQQVVDEYILRGEGRSFVVTREGAPLGLVTTHCIKETPRDDWPTTPAASCMIPVGELKKVRPDDELWAALQEMDRDGVNQLPVMSDDQLVGMLSRDDVIAYLRTRKEIGVAAR